MLTFFITLFIFVMQFLWKYIDELVGKGLEWYIVGELLFYASANLVPMALPLAILLASIMTFGSFGEHFELVAMKSAGLGLMRIMAPLLVVTLLTSALAFLFTNNIWPKANLEFASLLYDIRHKKPTFDITPGVYYEGIDGYVIRVGAKETDGKTLRDVLIYDHSSGAGNPHVIMAESGTMELLPNNTHLIFTLNNVRSYEELDGKQHPHMYSAFEQEIIRFNLSGFNMERTDKDLFKDNYQMLNLSQLSSAIDSHEQALVTRSAELLATLKSKSAVAADSTKSDPVSDSLRTARFKAFRTERKREILENALSQLRVQKTAVAGKALMRESNVKSTNRHAIEWHRKFTLSIACLILFFIGAPLGAIIRKGGLGLPVVISVLFFLAYHITSITFEKLAKEGEMEPARAMWMATVILLPIGFYLTYKASTDSRLFDVETYTRWPVQFLAKLQKR